MTPYLELHIWPVSTKQRKELIKQLQCVLNITAPYEVDLNIYLDLF